MLDVSVIHQTFRLIINKIACTLCLNIQSIKKNNTMVCMVESECANKKWHFNAHTIMVDCKEIHLTELSYFVLSLLNAKQNKHTNKYKTKTTNKDEIKIRTKQNQNDTHLPSIFVWVSVCRRVVVCVGVCGCVCVVVWVCMG